MEEWEQLHEVADENEENYEIVFLLAIFALLDVIDYSLLVDGVRTGNVNTIDRAMKWNVFRDELEKFKPIHMKPIMEAGEVVASNVASPKTMPPFNKSNPRIFAKVREQMDAMINDLVKETRQSVYEEARQMARQGKTPNEIAQNIKNRLGLTSLQTRSMQKLERDLIAKKVPARQRRRILKKEYEKKLMYRAERIARTESIRAVSEAQLIHWKDLANRGLIDGEIARKEWVVTPDDRLCELCAPLAGERRKLDEAFSFGGQSPPLHPNCRCSMRLIKHPNPNE